MSRLDDLTPDEAARVSPEDVTTLRSEWFPRAAATIDDGAAIVINGAEPVSCGAALRQWIARMAAHVGGDIVTVWRTPTDHLSALAVVRYGEDPRRWPGEWTAEDVVRAIRWERGEDVPGAVTGRAVIAAGTRLSITRAALTISREG